MIKHNKHTIYPCPQNKKEQLLNVLLEKYSEMNIVVINSHFTKDDKKEKINFLNCEEFLQSSDSYDLIINFNLSSDVQYLEMLTKATNSVIALINEEEQKELYAIEVVLKRAIRQEKIEGFEYKSVVLEEKKAVFVKKLKESGQKNESFKKNDNFKKGDGFKKSNSFKKDNKDGVKKDTPKWEKGSKKPNKFLGKDENGKAKFSGKSGERNHKYDGTPKSLEEKSVKRVIKKIIIKKEPKRE